MQTSSKTARIDPAILTEIAAKHLAIDTLEARNSDALDFHTVAVWTLQAALEAAFAAGLATAWITLKAGE
jgi:hypothetical protein